MSVNGFYILRLLEKACKFRLDNYLEDHKIIQNNQYGFRKKMGTDDALLDFTSFVYEKINNSEKILMVSLDIAKAFDSVEKNTLIKELDSVGVSGTTKKISRVI